MEPYRLFIALAVLASPEEKEKTMKEMSRSMSMLLIASFSITSLSFAVFGTLKTVIEISSVSNRMTLHNSPQKSYSTTGMLLLNGHVLLVQLKDLTGGWKKQFKARRFLVCPFERQLHSLHVPTEQLLIVRQELAHTSLCTVVEKYLIETQSIPKWPSDLFSAPAAKRSISCAPLHSLISSTVIIAAA